MSGKVDAVDKVRVSGTKFQIRSLGPLPFREYLNACEVIVEGSGSRSRANEILLYDRAGMICAGSATGFDYLSGS